MISRCLFILALAATLSPHALRAADVLLTPVTEKVYVIVGPLELPNPQNHGFRNNAVIVLTPVGVVVFDPGGSAWAGEMVVEKVKTLTARPIVAVFNSHGHGDHWLGNEGVARSYPDVAIYAHPKMQRRAAGDDGRRWLSVTEDLTQGTAGGKRVVVPKQSVRDGERITIGDTEFRIHHFGAAHTDHDIMIEVVGENVLFTGDVVRNGMLGIMESDASFHGNIAAIDTILAKGFTHYIPGHGRAGGVEVPTAYRNYLATLEATVRELYAEGLADYAMKPQAVEDLSGYRNWFGFDMRLGAHISRLYLEVEAVEF